jgi:hypothetical protein
MRAGRAHLNPHPCYPAVSAGFLREIAAIYEDFSATAPFGHEGGYAAAARFIATTKQQAADARKKVGLSLLGPAAVRVPAGGACASASCGGRLSCGWGGLLLRRRRSSRPWTYCWHP